MTVHENFDGQKVDTADSVVVRRTVTLSYTMTYKQDVPDSVVNATVADNDNLMYELFLTAPFDAKASAVTSTVLEGDERTAYLAALDAEIAKVTEAQKAQDELYSALADLFNDSALEG